MFARLFILTAGVWLATGPSLRALDFQVRSAEVEEDGFKHEQFYLQNDASSRVLLGLPAGWDRTADPGSLTLTSRTETDTMVRLEKSPLTTDLPFKDAALERYRRLALASVPPGATDVAVTGELDEPLPVFHWKSHEFDVDYVFFGRAFRRSAVFIDLNTREQILVTTVAPKAGFERARGAAFDVLRSWQVMPGR